MSGMALDLESLNGEYMGPLGSWFPAAHSLKQSQKQETTLPATAAGFWPACTGSFAIRGSRNPCKHLIIGKSRQLPLSSLNV